MLIPINRLNNHLFVTCSGLLHTSEFLLKLWSSCKYLELKLWNILSFHVKHEWFESPAKIKELKNTHRYTHTHAGEQDLACIRPAEDFQEWVSSFKGLWTSTTSLSFHLSPVWPTRADPTGPQINPPDGAGTPWTESTVSTRLPLALTFLLFSPAQGAAALITTSLTTAHILRSGCTNVTHREWLSSDHRWKNNRGLRRSRNTADTGRHPCLEA